MTHPIRARMIKAGVGLFVAMTLGAAAMSAPRTESGRTLVVSPEIAQRGRVYYVLPDRDAQIVYTSDAPLERVVGVSTRAVGYVVASEDSGDRASLLTGELRLPTASLNTGLLLRDEQLQSGRWFDAEDHPDLVFTLDHTENVSPSESTKSVETWSVDLVGALTVKGETHPLRASATVTLSPESQITRRRSPGDLMVIRSVFPVNLRQFGINDPAMSAGRFAESVSVDVYLMLSTVSPDSPANNRRP